MRKTKFVNGEYYHIYNRGVEKSEIFKCEADFLRFLKSVREFNEITPIGSLSQLQALRASGTIRLLEPEPLVEIICYCFSPNHYHFILKQLADNGISKFMLKLGMGYTNYFNVKNNRSGSLFQGTFKDVHIDNTEYLLWLSGYINGNVEIHKITEANTYKWSSYQDYLGLRSGTLCKKEVILSQFEGAKQYKEYVEMVVKESGSRKEEMKKYALEEF